MAQKKLLMQPRKKIALVAHDHKKDDLLAWATFNLEILQLSHRVEYSGSNQSHNGRFSHFVAADADQLPASAHRL
jgi:hypothetical protein